MVEGNKTFHYSYVDRLRQDVDITLINVNQLLKLESMEILEFIYSLFSDKEIPAWYTKADLENDKNQLKNWNAGQLSCSAAIRKGD